MMPKTTFLQHWGTLTAVEKRALAKRLFTSRDYLSKVAHRRRAAGPCMRDLARIVTGIDLDFQLEDAPNPEVPISGMASTIEAPFAKEAARNRYQLAGAV